MDIVERTPKSADPGDGCLSGKGLVRYDLGCGRARQPGYTGIDADPSVAPDIVADITNLRGVVCDGVADAIWCAHVLEHIPHPQYIHALHEMARILKPGGTFTILVPHPAHDMGMVPGHLHIIPPHHWKSIQDDPQAWFGWGNPWLVIESIESRPTSDADDITKRFGLTVEEAMRYLRNTASETIVKGHRP